MVNVARRPLINPQRRFTIVGLGGVLEVLCADDGRALSHVLESPFSFGSVEYGNDGDYGQSTQRQAYGVR
jgi:hypothetical protein